MSLNLAQRTAIDEALAKSELVTVAPIHVHFRGLCKSDPMREATKFFLLNRMDKTPMRNGVLIFIAEESRRLAIIADEGAHQKVPEDFWEDCQRVLVNFFKKGEMIAGIEHVVDLIARRLQHDFPPIKKS